MLKNRYMLYKHKDKATGNIVPVFQITTIFDKQISCNIKKSDTLLSIFQKFLVLKICVIYLYVSWMLYIVFIWIRQ